jgi:hypothetical protein
MLQFGDDPRSAPVVHFNGRLSMTLDDDMRDGLPLGREFTLAALVGTPGRGEGAFAALHHDNNDEVVPRDAHPVAVIEFPTKEGGTGRVKVSLAQPCCDVRFYQTVRLPDQAVAGKAKVTLSFAAWTDGHVIPATLEVPVVAGA